jgi:predicted small secreted protein
MCGAFCFMWPGLTVDRVSSGIYREFMSLRPYLQCIAVVLAATSLPACTTVVIHGDGKVVTERHFGFVKVMIGEQRSAAVAVSSLGVSALPGSFTLGWTDWRGISIGQDDAGSCLFVNFDTTHARE